MKNPHIPLERYQDGLDVLREYDQSVGDWLTIPIALHGNHRYTRSELEVLEIDDLIDICTARGIYSGDEPQTPPREVFELIILNNQRVPVIYGSPSPQFARQYLLIGQREAYKNRSIRYPIIALNRLTIDPDRNRFSLPMRRTISWSQSGREVAQSRQPIPVLFTYQADVLSNKVTQMNQIDAGLRRIFGVNHQWVTINHGSPWGELPVSIIAEQSYSDQSTEESDSEQAEKILRHVYTITVEGWLPQETMMVKTVLKIRTDIQEGDDLLLSLLTDLTEEPT